MYPGEFTRALRKLNPSLKIWAGNDDTKPAGIFYVDETGYRSVCGVDKNWIPEWSEFTSTGGISKGGWRRVVWMLLRKNLTSYRSVLKVFPGFFLKRIKNTSAIPFDLQEEMKLPDMRTKLGRQQIAEKAYDLRSKDDSYTKERHEKFKWEYNRDVQKGRKTMMEVTR